MIYRGLNGFVWRLRECSDILMLGLKGRCRGRLKALDGRYSGKNFCIWHKKSLDLTTTRIHGGIYSYFRRCVTHYFQLACACLLVMPISRTRHVFFAHNSSPYTSQTEKAMTDVFNHHHEDPLVKQRHSIRYSRVLWGT